MKLIWDCSQYKITINEIDIHISSKTLPPFNAAAVVEEQDTSLVLEPVNEIPEPGNKPLWYFSNILEYQALKQPGDIIIKPGKPLRFWAIIHDLEQVPSWRSEWIAKALVKILSLAEEKTIVSICLPVLGAQFGHFKLEDFIDLLVQILLRNRPVYLQRIWLVIPPESYQTAFLLLSQFSSNRPGKKH